jgi:hypothetical protein
MKKLFSAMAAALLVLAVNGFAAAQDQPQMAPRDAQRDTRPETKAEPIQPGQSSNVIAKEQEYLAALKSCDSIVDAGDRQKCFDTVKKKYSQM